MNNNRIEDRLKTWNDVAEYHGINPYTSLPYRAPRNKLERSINATFKIQKISEALNEGKILDWNNRDQRKYYPYFEKSDSGWVVGSCYDRLYFASVGSGCYFISSDKALYAANQFLDIYIDYLPE